tara:strand:+ start:25 stop:174 length:150 start_codon:yes stop_codon:yes gene_type:complete
MGVIDYVFTFGVGAFFGSLATSWANVLFLEPPREEKQEQEIINKIDRYV